MGQTVSFSSTSSGAVLSSFDWDFGDGSSSTAENPTHSYGQAGSYAVTLTVGGRCGTDSTTKVDFITVAATFGMAGAILTEASLSFLGLGVPPPVPSWGQMLTAAQKLTVLATMPWLWVPPGVMIALTVLCVNFVGDGLRDALDPQTQLG